jgi:iron complex outermembrane receptor protein
MFRAITRAALVASALFGAVPLAHAADAPPITGVVRDAEGAPLPNARVTIAEINRSTTTAGDGSFTFRALRAGTYHLDVTLLGYAPSHSVVRLPETGDAVTVEIRLRATPLAIEGINVTASPGSADPLRITQSTAEISGKELERNLGASVAQTLSTQPGLSVRYSGPAASTPVIRGLSGERVLVLENGQRTGDLSSSSPDHSLSLDPLAATRLEVVRGPASLLYGSNALGGVVNVISTTIPTTVPSHAEGYLAAQGESVNPGGALSGEVTLPVGSSLAVTGRGGYRNVDDVRGGGGDVLGNSAFRNRYAMGGVGFIGERVQGGVSGGGYGFNYGLPASATAAEQGVTIRGERYEATGRADITMAERGFTTLRIDASGQRYTHDEVEESGEVGTTFRLNTQTAAVTGRTTFGRWTGAVGLSGLFRQYSPTGEEALTPGARTRNGGIFVYQDIPLGAAESTPHLQVGARYDVYRLVSDDSDDARFGAGRTRDFNNLSGSAGLSVPFGTTVSANVSVGRSFRAPTVEELFSDAFHAATGSYEVGDPDLGVETNTGVEAVLRGQSERLNAQLSAFYNRIDNYIAPIRDGSTTVETEEGTAEVPRFEYRQRDAMLRGVEGQVEGRVGGHFVVGGMGDVVIGDFASDQGPLPFMPPARVGGLLRYDDGRRSLGVEARHAFEQSRVPFVDGGTVADGAEGEQPTDGYNLVNLSGGLSIIRAGQVHSITLRVDNVLDERYFDAASRIKDFAPNPGRNLSLVYRLLF